MAAGTVGYTDTRSESRDYLGMIAGQISKRVGEASDMAASERQFAADQAEAGGTSLEEAGIGKGYFFGRALGSKFGGDRIARTRGRFATTPTAGTNPTGTAASRFRGGFNYTVENSINAEAGSPQVATAMSGISDALIMVSQSLVKIDSTLGGIERTQMNMARAIMFQGYVMQMLKDQQAQAAGRASMNREERSLEGGGGGAGGGSIGGQSFGGAGGGRGMINVTDTRAGSGGGGGSGGSGGSGRPSGTDGFGPSDIVSFATSQLIPGYGKGSTVARATRQTANYLRTGKAGTGVRSMDVLRGAAKSIQTGGKFDPNTVSRNLSKLVDGGGTTSKFSKVVQAVFKSPNAQKAGIQTAQQVVENSNILAKSGALGVDITEQNFKRLNDSVNMLGGNAKASFADELAEIQLRSDKFQKLSKLHGNSKIRQLALNKEFMEDIAMNKATFKKMKDLTGKRMFTNDMIEQFIRLGISPGEKARNFPPLLAKTTGGIPMGPKGSGGLGTPFNIAEDLNKFFPDGVHKFKTADDAIITTTFARRLETIKKGVKASKKEAKEALKYTEAVFGQKATQKAIIEGGEALATNTMVAKSLAGIGGSRAGKIIPGVGLALGAYFAIDRARKGDLWGAGLELGSGILGLLPGFGSGAGFAIDAYLLARDMGVMPLKKGVVATGSAPINAVFGEAGLQEAAFPLEGSEGIIAGTVFGDAAAAALAGNFFAKGANGGDSLMEDLNSSAQDISNKMNQLSTEVQSLATSPPNIINNITNNNMSPSNGGNGGDDVSGGGGNFSDSGLDAWRLNYLGSLA